MGNKGTSFIQREPTTITGLIIEEIKKQKTGWTNDKIAQHIGATRGSTISKFVYGKQFPTFEQADKLEGLYKMVTGCDDCPKIPPHEKKAKLWSKNPEKPFNVTVSLPPLDEEQQNEQPDLFDQEVFARISHLEQDMNQLHKIVANLDEKIQELVDHPLRVHEVEKHIMEIGMEAIVHWFAAKGRSEERERFDKELKTSR